MKNVFFKLIITTFSIIGLFFYFEAKADNTDNLGKNLSGRILLQVQQNGEAWYVNPEDTKKYFLSRPADGLILMKKFGIGITNQNLEKIPLGLIENNDIDDNDNDGLDYNLEIALGTNPQKSDSDNDSFNDKTEILGGYNPNGVGKINIDLNFAQKYAGKIFLQIEKNGEAWYVNPSDNKKYFLGRPIIFFNLLKRLGLGITNDDLKKIATGQLVDVINPPIESETEIIYAAADAIRANDAEKFKSFFTKENHTLVEYIMSIFDDEQRLTLGNILSGSKLTNATEEEKIYSNEIYFSLGSYKVPIKYYVKKQADGTWKMTNL